MVKSLARRMWNYSRTHYRVTANLPVIIMTTATGGVGRVTDISVTGCTVQAPFDIQPGSQVALRVRFPNEQKCLDVESAIVRWTDGTRHGLEFVRLSALSQRRLYSSLFNQVTLTVQNLAAGA